MDKAKLRRDIATAYGLLKNAVAALDEMEEGSLCPEDDSDIFCDLTNYQFLLDADVCEYTQWDETASTIVARKCWAKTPNPWAE